MTSQLFLDDSFTSAFTSVVVTCEADAKLYQITLTDSYFYPEGGGQPSDRGQIDQANVLDVQKGNGDIIHYVDQPLDVGQVVHCQVDVARRRDFMEQHTGQHVLSAVAFRDLCAQTVGFHLTEDNLTIDYDRVFSADDLEHLAIRTNQLIRQALPIRVHYPTLEQLKAYDLRKRPPVSKNIRLIEIENYDIVPCGGTHLAHTGQLGNITITDSSKYKGGMRLTVACGDRAIRRQLQLEQIIAELTALTASPVRQIVDRVTDYKQKIVEQVDALCDYKMAQITSLVDDVLAEGEQVADSVVVAKLFDTLSKDDFKQLTTQLLVDFSGVALLANQTQTGGQLVMVNQQGNALLDVKLLFSELCQRFKLKGGGSAWRCQGACPTDSTVQIFHTAHRAIIQTLNPKS